MSPHPFQPDHEKTPLPSDSVSNPKVVGTAWYKQRSTTIAASPLWVPRRTGFYRISVMLQQFNSGAGNTFDMQGNVGFTDTAGGPATLLVARIGPGIPGPAVNRAQGMLVFEALAGYPINHDLTLTSALGAPVVNARFQLEEIA